MTTSGPWGGKGALDQIITWVGQVAAFRWDNANIDIKNFSVGLFRFRRCSNNYGIHLPSAGGKPYF
jgi:hypothetical protein